jgi:hypothetical protein
LEKLSVMAAEQANGSNFRDDSKTVDESVDGSNYRDDSKTVDESVDGSNYRDDSKGISEIAASSRQPQRPKEESWDRKSMR